MKESFVEILDRAQRNEDRVGAQSPSNSHDAEVSGAAPGKSLDVSSATTAEDFRKEWDGADNMYEPSGFMLLMSAISLVAIFALLFRSLHLDFGVFEVTSGTADTAWFLFAFSKFMNALPILNIFDDFRSQTDAIRATSLLAEWVTGTAKFCFDFFAISIAVSILVGHANKRRAEEFFGSDTLLGIIADCRDEKASGMLSSIADALRATVERNPENLEAIRFYAASTAMLKAKAHTDKIGEAINYLSRIVDDKERTYSETTRRTALESAFLLLAPVEPGGAKGYNPGAEDKKIVGLWYRLVDESLGEKNPGGLAASARTFLARTSGMNVGTDRQISRFQSIIEIRQRLDLSSPVPAAVSVYILGYVAEALEKLLVQQKGSGAEQAENLSSLGYADAWLKELIGKESAKIEDAVVFRTVSARIYAFERDDTKTGVDPDLAARLRDRVAEHRALDRDGKVLRSALKGPATYKDGELVRLLQTASGKVGASARTRDRDRLIVDSMPVHLLVEFVQKRLKSYASHAMPYLFDRLSKVSTDGLNAREEERHSAEEQFGCAQAILLTAFRRYGEKPDVDLHALHNESRESLARAIQEMASRNIVWASNKTFDFLKFEKGHFNRRRWQRHRSLPEERKRRLINAALKLLDASGRRDKSTIEAVKSWIQHPEIPQDAEHNQSVELQSRGRSRLLKLFFPRRRVSRLAA